MGKLVSEISKYFTLEEKHVNVRLKNHNNFYRTVFIPKKSGGLREIYLPSPEIKAFQHYILEKYLYKIEISDYATAYRKGVSIIDNISIHIGNNAFLKIDLENFFDSLNYNNVKHILCLELKDQLSESDIDDLLQFITYKNKFVQGCVTSPYISNILFKKIDQELFEALLDIADLKYSRYSDDIVISSSSYISESVLLKIGSILRKNGFTINEKKTYFTSNINSIRITGLNLVGFSDVKVGTKYKKELKNMIYHKLKFRDDSRERTEVILGKLMFLKNIEPDYYNILNLKYKRNNKLLIDILREIHANELEHN